MFTINNLIEPRMGKLIFTHLIGNNCLKFRNRLLDSYFFQLTLGSCLFLNSRFQNLPDSVILQKYELLLHQSFKHNSTHMPSLNLTPKFSFGPRFRILSLTFTTRKVDACSS